MKILVINGANINMLGIREPEIYGRATYEDLCALIEAHAKALGLTLVTNNTREFERVEGLKLENWV